MEYCKLQIGCMVVVLYIIFIYCREKALFRIHQKFSLYEALLCIGFVGLLLDGVTAYTVNHLDTVNRTLNMVLHAFFLLSLDALIFTVFLYILYVTEGSIHNKKRHFLLYTPFVLNTLVVLLGIPSLEYRTGKISNYSMGFSVYACFIMVGVYILITIAIVFRRWNNIQKNKRISILTCLLALMGISVYQAIFPDTLVTSIVTTIVILGLYTNEEDPAMQELSRYHEEMVMGFATLVESRDSSTGGHVKRTTNYVELLTKELKRRGYYKDILTADYVKNLLLAAPMHDIGKIAVPDSILQKPGKLTEEEFEIMKTHSVKGEKLYGKPLAEWEMNSIWKWHIRLHVIIMKNGMGRAIRRD